MLTDGAGASEIISVKHHYYYLYLSRRSPSCCCQIESGSSSAVSPPRPWPGCPGTPRLGSWTESACGCSPARWGGERGRGGRGKWSEKALEAAGWTTTKNYTKSQRSAVHVWHMIKPLKQQVRDIMDSCHGHRSWLST